MVQSEAPLTWRMYQQYYVGDPLFLEGSSGTGDEEFESTYIHTAEARSVTGKGIKEKFEEEKAIQRQSIYDCPPILDVPKVPRLICIYGTNLTTEVSYYFKRSKGTFSLDSAADSMSKTAQPANPSGLMIKGGVGYEREVEGATKSGDGTVPYCSLAYPREWVKMMEERNIPKDDRVKIQMIEVQGAEHREMLKDESVLMHILSTVSSFDQTLL
mmetsp:Transcript_24676/g.33932  ORF Transcript_24676/g.33932 Transcript_24676/m.33932 type:complete len:214 (+) Transcript_24676:2033-2674(+)